MNTYCVVTTWSYNLALNCLQIQCEQTIVAQEVPTPELNQHQRITAITPIVKCNSHCAIVIKLI